MGGRRVQAGGNRGVVIGVRRPRRVRTRLTNTILAGVLLVSANAGCLQPQPIAEPVDISSSSQTTINASDKIALYQRYTHSRLIGWTRDGSAIVQASGAAGGNLLPVQMISQPGQAPKVVFDAPATIAAARLVGSAEGGWLFSVGGGNGEKPLAYTVKAGFSESATQIPESSGVEELAQAGSKPLLAVVTKSPNAGLVLTLVNVETRSRTRLMAMQKGVNIRDLTFSRDDRHLAFVSVARGATSLWVVDLASARAKKVPTSAKRLFDFRRPQFSAQGDQLVTEVALDGMVRLVVVDIRTGKTAVLTPRLKADVREFAVSSGTTVALTTFESGTSVLRFFDLKTNLELPRPALLKGEIRNLRWKVDMPGVLGFNLASLRSPSEVYTYDLKSTKLTRWTNGASPGLPLFGLPEPEWVAWQKTPSPAFLQLWRPDETMFAGKRPVLLLFRDEERPTWPAGYLGRDTYLLAEAGVALVALVEPGITCQPGPDGIDRLNFLLQQVVAWIGQQPNLDGEKIILDCQSVQTSHSPAIDRRAINLLGLVEYPADARHDSDADAAARLQQVLGFIGSAAPAR